MATHSALGPAATVRDAKLKKWWQERKWAEDIEESKAKSGSRARQGLSSPNSGMYSHAGGSGLIAQWQLTIAVSGFCFASCA
jgi:hypothetical protein